ncbi:MAG: M67 family metallopeptidase [Balneolaceae bacterium]|nr:M67 family metallopeptidase [Balneolaceae bacterium]
MMKLDIKENALNDMLEHAEQAYPDECCGFMYGSATGDQRSVVRAGKVRNAKEGDRSDRFEIDPEDYRKAESYAAESELDLIGVYHSHPDHPAEPSEHDRKVAMPWFSYVIVSVRKGRAADIRSWQLNENRSFEEETVAAKDFTD